MSCAPTCVAACKMPRQGVPSSTTIALTLWPDAASSTLLEDALVDFEVPDGDAFYWIALESRRARMMRKFIEGHLQVPKDWIRATGYWKASPDEAE